MPLRGTFLQPSTPHSAQVSVYCARRNNTGSLDSQSGTRLTATYITLHRTPQGLFVVHGAATLEA